ncbi:hypothetical protein [Flammeovirga kamogawensis]|uniref:DUF3826 domain-containing protein n=1 Tax=Flammeovirga kamogawensis TaxID=373891 RepID=A0ABX8H0J3_9BACT|nr:hypothetical protein [Flammeovirga kamogawensis]MBB6462185.1 enamine deaminase RidA (YjgF/YER057c/UK114 family) [Flammeovirga kamogawensis]QWG09414.1 hypothetical protein KM029_22670 [Flammeovirga kamogawensis]TRX64932.1 hypothetical protein EO216_20580 [Flammeovirga kamogawensis]
MVWVLLFMLIFSSTKGDEFIIPNFEKYVKKHVEDKDKVKAIVGIVKESAENRKEANKKDNLNRKELNTLFINRATTTQEFDAFFDSVIVHKTKIRKTNIEVLSKSQEIISKEEWDKFIPDLKNDILKLQEKSDSKLINTAKYFGEVKKETQSVILDKEREKNATLAFENFEVVLNNSYQSLIDKVCDQNSILYQYNITDDEYEKVNNFLNKVTRDVFDAYSTLHKELVANTTQEEWDHFSKKLSIPKTK